MVIEFDTCRCKEGFYLLKNKQQCAQCQSPCGTCKNDKNDGSICTSCLDPIMALDSHNNCVCPPGYFISVDNTKCTQCTAPCLSCKNSGMDTQECLECWDENMVVNDNCNCKMSYYMTNDYRDCAACPLSCPNCTSNFHNEALCLSCIDQNMAVNTFGICECSDRYFLLKNKVACAKCEDYPCKLCTNNGMDKPLCTLCVNKTMILTVENECICPNQYFISYNKTVCISCPIRCVHCIGYYIEEVDVPVCIECRDKRDMELPSCYCKEGYTLNEEGNDCIECPKTCKTCKQRYADIYCDTCKDKLMIAEDKCRCPDTTTVSQDFSMCLACSTDGSCKKCTDVNGILQCQECSEQGMIILKDRCECVQGFYFNQGCKQCDIRCKTCKGPSNSECISCIGKHVVMKNDKCDCEGIYTLINGECKVSSSGIVLVIVVGIVALFLASIIIGLIALLCS